MERRTFLNREFIGSLLWIAVGLVFCIGGIRYGLYYDGGPGPGFIAFVAGIVLSSLGLVVLMSSILSVKDRGSKTEKIFPEEDSFRKVFIVTLGLCFYALAFEYLGLLFTTFLIMIFMLRFIEPLKWKTIWITAILTAISFYLVFQVVLKIPVPRGIFGI